jgi:addiction module HigA family antidote
MFPENRPPITAGETLQRTFLDRLKMSPEVLAEQANVPVDTIEDLLADEIPCDAELALRLSAVFGTLPGFWMSVQAHYDLWAATRRIEGELVAN